MKLRKSSYRSNKLQLFFNYWNNFFHKFICGQRFSHWFFRNIVSVVVCKGLNSPWLQYNLLLTCFVPLPQIFVDETLCYWIYVIGSLVSLLKDYAIFLETSGVTLHIFILQISFPYLGWILFHMDLLIVDALSRWAVSLSPLSWRYTYWSGIFCCNR